MRRGTLVAVAGLVLLALVVSPPLGVAPIPVRADGPPDSNQGGGTPVPADPPRTDADKDIDQGDEKEPNGDEGQAPTGQQTGEETEEVEGTYLDGPEGGQPAPHNPGGCTKPRPGKGAGGFSAGTRPSIRPAIRPPMEPMNLAGFTRTPSLPSVGEGVGLNLNYRSRVEYNGAFGQGWDFTANQSVSLQTDGSMNWASGRGVDVPFSIVGAGQWAGPSNTHQKLVDLGASMNPRWALSDTFGNQQLFRADGKLGSMQDRFGATIQFAYDPSGRLNSVTDSRGETATLLYHSTGRLKAIDDWVGRRTLFEYDANDDLVAVKYWDPQSTQTRTVTMQYTSGHSDNRLNHNLTATKDFQGATRYSVSYGVTGVALDRVATKQIAGGRAYTYQFLGTMGVDWTTKISSGGTNLFDYHYSNGGLLADETVYATQDGQSGVALTTRFTYNGNLELTKTVLPNGQRRERTLDAQGNVLVYRVKETDTDQNSASDLVWSASYETTWNQPTTVTRPDNSTISFQYNAQGCATRIDEQINTSGTVATTLQSWNAKGQVTSRTDPDGIQTSFTYGSIGGEEDRVVSVSRGPAGQQLTTTYTRTSTGEVASVTDPVGNRTDYSVSMWGEAQGVTSPSSLGYEITYERDQNYQVNRVNVENVNENGVRDSALPWIRRDPARDAAGNITSITEDISASTQRTFHYSYNDRHFVERVTLPEGNSNKYEYEERGLVSRVRLAEGTSVEGVWEFKYDAVGNATQTTDPRGKTATFQYNGFGALTQTTTPLGAKRVLVRDKMHRVVEARVESASSTVLAKTEYTYDLMGRVIETREHEFGPGLSPTVRTTSITRRPGGQPTTVQFPDGYTLTYSYDAWGRCTEVRDPGDNRVTYVYDASSRVSRQDHVEKEGSTEKTYSTEFEYDAVNRVNNVRNVDANNANTVIEQTLKYDSRGNVVEIAGGGGPTKRLVYDAQDRLLSEHVDPLGLNRTTQSSFDKNDRLLGYSDPSGNATTFEYDARNRRTSVVYPNNAAVDLEYDAAGNLTRLSDLMGTIVDSTYDNDGRLTHRSINRGPGVLGTTAEDYVWDAAGRLTEARNDSSTVQLTYDSRGHKLSETLGPNPIGTAGRAVSYSYGADGLLSGVTYPSGFIVGVQRDALRRLTTLSDSGGFGTTTLSYLGSKRPQQVTHSNGTKSDYAWDGMGRLQWMKHSAPGGTPFYHVDFLFRDDGKKLYERNLLAGGIGDVYQYLPDGRLGSVAYGVSNPLSEVQNPGSQPFQSRTSYAFDAVGNRSSVTVTPGGGGTPTVTSYQANSLNQYTSVGGQARAYDANGNLATVSNKTYEYDFAGHLLKATVGSTVVGTYEYDALGRRISKSTQSGVTSYVYSGDDIVEEYASGGSLSARLGYLESPDGRVFYEAPDHADVNQNGNSTEWMRFTFHGDVRGSPTHVTSPTGAVVESYTYDAYGQPTIKDRLGQTATASPIRNDFLFTGREWDAETGLYHYRNRSYDPETGSFLQRDPLRYRAGPHLYQYVTADPVNFMDPFGLDKTPDKSGGTPGPTEGDGGTATPPASPPISPEERARRERNGRGGPDADPEYRPGGLLPEEEEPEIDPGPPDDPTTGPPIGLGPGGNHEQPPQVGGTGPLDDPWDGYRGPSDEEVEALREAYDQNAEWFETVHTTVVVCQIVQDAVAVGAAAMEEAGGAAGAVGRRSKNLPVRGKPNSTAVRDDGMGNGQIRDYGPDGRAKTDYDFGHDHNGAGDPHAHDWNWNNSPPRGPARSIRPNE